MTTGTELAIADHMTTVGKAIVAVRNRGELVSQSDLDWADQMLRGVSSLIKRVEEHRTARTRPLLAQKSAVDAEYKPLRKRLQQLDDMLRDALTDATRRRHADQEKALARVAESGGAVDQNTLAVAHGQDAELDAPQGIQEVSHLEVECVDFASVPREWLMPDMDKILAAYEAARGAISIPGIKVHRVWGIKRKGVVTK